MKIIHSLWTYPIRNKEKNQHNRTSGGWMSEKYHYMSWIFSNLLAKTHYPQIELFTDDYGAELLTQQIGIEYDKVHIKLNHLEKKYSPNLWAIGKMETYNLQNEPFLHIDGDVFLFDKLNIDISKTDLLCQNIDVGYPPYAKHLESIRSSFSFIPDELRIKKDKIIMAANTGVFGGTDIPFIQRYVEKAFEFLNKNDLNLINNYSLNILVEQLLLFELLGSKRIKTIFPDNDNLYNLPKVQQWHLIPHLKPFNFIHMIFGSKRNQVFCEQLELRFLYLFPYEYTAFIQRMGFEDIRLEKPDRTKRFLNIFKNLSCSFVNLLNQKLVLNHKYKIVDNKIFNKVTQTSFELKAMSKLLLAFKDEVSMNEIIEHFQDGDTNNKDVVDTIFNFVMEGLIYSGIIDFK